MFNWCFIGAGNIAFSKEIKQGLLQSKIITKENTILCMELMDECRRQMGLFYPNEKE